MRLRVFQIALFALLLFPNLSEGKIDFTARSKKYQQFYAPIKSSLTAALKLLLKEVNADEKIEVKILVDIGPQKIKGAGCQSEEFVLAKKTEKGKIYQQGLAAFISMPHYPFKKKYHLKLLINEKYLLKQLWFDPDPDKRTAVIPKGQQLDAYSVFMHELLHAFAFNGWLDSKTGVSRSPNKAQSTYDIHVIRRGSQLYFNGPEARKVYGGPVPLNRRNYKHYGNLKGAGENLKGLVMFGEFYQWRHRFMLSNLDKAILRDCGIGGEMQEKRISPAEKGRARALKDMAQGIFQLLIYGELFPDGKVHYDKETGLPLVNEEGDDITKEYQVEVEAYNQSVRAYLKKHPR